MSHAALYLSAHADACSCGETADHVVADKTTSDGRRVEFWSDGMVTWAMGWRVRGIGRARSRYERRMNLEAAWVVAGIAGLLTAAEVPIALRIARREIRADVRGQVGIDRPRLERTTLRALAEKRARQCPKCGSHETHRCKTGTCRHCDVCEHAWSPT